MHKTNAPGYYVNEQGAIINDDELAWMKFKAERESAQRVQQLIEEVEILRIRIEMLERKFNETITSD